MSSNSAIRKIGQGIMILMIAVPALAAADDSRFLSLKYELLCGGPEFTVGDLVDPTPSGELAAHVLGRSPLPGRSSTLSRNRLERILRQLGWDGILTGALEIKLTTPVVELDPTALRPAVTEKLTENLAVRGLQLQGDIQGWPRSINLSTSSLRWQLDLDRKLQGRDGSALVEVTDRGGFRTSFRIRFRCTRNMVVPVASNSLKPGSLLSAWTFEERDSFKLDGRPLTRDELTGSVARRHLKAGQSITTHNMQAAPLVNRGREVTIKLQRGAVSVSLSGIAQGDGAMGDLVMVRHLDTRQLRRYRVTGMNRVSPTYIELTGGER